MGVMRRCSSPQAQMCTIPFASAALFIITSRAANVRGSGFGSIEGISSYVCLVMSNQAHMTLVCSPLKPWSPKKFSRSASSRPGFWCTWIGAAYIAY